MSANSPRQMRLGKMPTGTQVAQYKTYEQAVAGVDKLAAEHFPLASVTIVGSDLHAVEQVGGKLTPGRIATVGAGQGLTWGLLMGLITLVAVPDIGPYVAIVAVIMGVLAGILLNVIGWSISPKKRRFYGRTSMVASRYAILVSEQPDRAHGLLQGTDGNLGASTRSSPRTAVSGAQQPSRTTSERKAAKPPQFGVRLSDLKDGSEDGIGGEDEAGSQDQTEPDRGDSQAPAQ